jgi:hypothetical protein
MKILIVIILTLWNLNIYSQLNMDSILIEINSKNFLKTGHKKYLSVEFQRFENTKGNEIFDVYFDSTGKIGEYIGVSLINRAFDDEGRLINQYGYDRNGNYFLWDFDPIITYNYKNNTTIKNAFNSKNELTYRSISITDSLDRVINYFEFNQYLEQLVNCETTYLDSSNLVRIKNYSAEGLLIDYRNKPSVKEIQMDSNNNLAEIRFYDSNLKQFDGQHSHQMSKMSEAEFNPNCTYSIVKFILIDDKVVFQYFNSFGELVCEGLPDGTVWSNLRL